MAKGGFDTIIDNIEKRDTDDVVGVKPKKTEKKEEKKSTGYSVGGMIDKIRDRDDEKIYNRGVYKEGETPEKEGKKEEIKEEKPVKKGSGMSFTSMIDAIQDRDKDDAAGVKPKKKA
jgi:hypothetical protein